MVSFKLFDILPDSIQDVKVILLSDSKFSWSTFEDMYEKIRSGMSRELKAKVRLHKWMWPPSFLIWYTNVGFRFRLDVHYDSNLQQKLDKGKKDAKNVLGGGQDSYNS